MATSLAPHSQNGGATPKAGNMTCSVAHTAPKWATPARIPLRPAAPIRPRTAPHDVPYPQWTRVEKRTSSFSPLGSTPRTLAAASAGAELAGRPRSFISIVLERVIAAVPAAPAKSPLPTAAATSPSFILRSPSRLRFLLSAYHDEQGDHRTHFELIEMLPLILDLDELVDQVVLLIWRQTRRQTFGDNFEDRRHATGARPRAENGF